MLAVLLSRELSKSVSQSVSQSVVVYWAGWLASGMLE